MSRVYDALRRVTAGDSLPARQPDDVEPAVLEPESDFILRRKIVATFAGLIVLLGLITLASVYYFTARGLREQLEQRAAALATTLSDAAAAHLMGRNALELYALVRKYTRLDGVAYAFIEDNRGEIVAHTLGNVPYEVREGLGQDRRQIGRRQVNLQGNKVHEVRVPIFEGQLGAAHVGIWESTVQEQIRRTLVPLLVLLTVVLLVGVLLSVLLGRRVSQLIER